MANGKKGDSPLWDTITHGLHPFPPDMEAMLREVLALDPIFPDGKRPYVDQVRWIDRFYEWEKGLNLDEGRVALREVLEDLRSKRS